MEDENSSPSAHSDWLAQFQAMASAAVQRQVRESEARERSGRLRPSQRHGANGSSSVFTLRLDHDERAALEARADALGLKPSVLARNYIRFALMHPRESADEAVERIDAAVAELRARAS